MSAQPRMRNGMAAKRSGLTIMRILSTRSSTGIIQKPKPIEANRRAKARLNIMLMAPKAKRPAMTYIIPCTKLVGIIARITPRIMLPIPTMGNAGNRERLMVSSVGVSISLPRISDMACNRSAILLARRFSA